MSAGVGLGSIPILVSESAAFKAVLWRIGVTLYPVTGATATESKDTVFGPEVWVDSFTTIHTTEPRRNLLQGSSPASCCQRTLGPVSVLRPKTGERTKCNKHREASLSRVFNLPCVYRTSLPC